MKIILLKEVPGLGHIGEIKEVKEGYAYNFLIPKNLAAPANKHTLRVTQDQAQKKEKNIKKNKQKKELIAKKIKNKKFIIQAKSDEAGTLYAGLDAKDISIELKKQGFNLEKQDIILPEKIKKTGEQKINLKLADKEVQIKLLIK